MGPSSFLIGVYPFVVSGAIMAMVACTWAYIKLRHTDFVIRWLFAGIIITMFAMTMENIYFGLGRTLGVIDPGENLGLISVWKFLYAFGCWMHVFGAYAAIKGLSDGWVKRIIGAGLLGWIAAYLGLVWYLY